MKENFRNLSYSGFQLLMNQLLAFLIFLFLSKQLGKEDFGLLNWSLAFLLIAFSALSFGMDQVLIKKIAAGEEGSASLSVVFFIHALAGGIVFYVLLFSVSFFFFKDLSLTIPLLMLAAGKFFLSLSLPFKSMAAGKERFGLLLFMSLPSNLLKAAGLMLLFLMHSLDLRHAVFVFIAGDVSEFIVCFFVARKYFSPIAWNAFALPRYLRFLREVMPQFGIVVFSMALSKFDHVVLGMFTNASVVGEYSFASRICDLFTFPLLVIGPLLLPFVSRNRLSGLEQKMPRLLSLLRLEIVLACLSFLVLNLLWTPVVDAFSGGKYGKVNEQVIFYLSLSIPFLYVNNFIWTLNFTAGKLKTILLIFGSSFLVNLGADLVLIPLYGSKGAAIAYLCSIVFQWGFYIYTTRFEGWRSAARTFLAAFVFALLPLLIPAARNFHLLITLGLSSFIFIVLLLLSRQLKTTDLRLVRALWR